MDKKFVKVDLGDKGIWWRLYTGCFTTKQAAMKARDVYNLTESIVQRTRYANLVGSTSTEKELFKKYKRLISMEYSPYLIKTSGDDIRMYVGAFITIKGAKDLQRELREKGILTQVVKR